MRRLRSLSRRVNHNPVVVAPSKKPNCRATPASVDGNRTSIKRCYFAVRSPALIDTDIQFSCGGRAQEYSSE